MDLSKTNLDFDAIAQELEADLQNRETFKSLFPGETSKVFVDHGSAITALMLFHTHLASRSAFLNTADSKPAVYASAISLGNPPTRKLGSQLTLQVTVNSNIVSAIVLPQFSRFSARGLEWYTIEDNIIPIAAPGQVLNFQVRQGERITESFTANGKDNQRIEIGEDFNIDEQFLTVTVDTVEFTSNGSSLLDATQGDSIYAEQTSSNGRVLILFGNAIIGIIPTLGQVIDISYANTGGLNSNSSIVNDVFQYVDQLSLGGGEFLDLTGLSTTTASGGTDEESADQVKNTAPRLFAANKRAVRRDDYIGNMLKFSGASAALAWGEYEEALQKGFANNTMMNRAFVTLVPNTLSKQSNIFTTANGIDTSFSISSGLTNLMPGTLVVSSITGASFDDRDGRGLLLSDSVSFDLIGAGVGTANDNPGNAPLAFDGSPATTYFSSVAPTVFAPIRIGYDLGLGNEIEVASIRLRSSDDPILGDRSFPRQVKILASTLAAPDINNPDDWDVVRGITLLEEPGFNALSRWVPVDDLNNTILYRHIAIEVLDRFGTGNTTKISEVELQQISDSSTIDYENGDLVLRYQVAPTGDMTATAFTGNLSSAQKDDVLDFLADLNHFTTLLEYRNPVGRLVTVIASIFSLEGFDTNTVLAAAQTAIDDLFTVAGTSIGQKFFISDIYQALQDVEGIDYTILESPLLDLELEINEFIILNEQFISIFPTDR